MSPAAVPALSADPFYQRLKDRLIAATGMVFYADKDEELCRIVAQRLGAQAVRNCGQYLDLLAEDVAGKEEMDALVAEMTIGETYFFRHKEQFDALRETVLPTLFQKNADSRRLRVWSAGCATGAEPYTLAIILQRDFAHRLRDWKVDILATDINKRFLGMAQRGKFGKWALRATPDAIRDACFTADGPDAWTLRPPYRDMVTFQYHNLVETPFPSMVNNLYAFDLILCRNVTIYFSRETIRRIIDRFDECLVGGGWLVAGHSEVDLELFRAFRTVNATGAVLYQKTGDPAERGRFHGASTPAAEPPAPPAPKTPSNGQWVAPDLGPAPALFDTAGQPPGVPPLPLPPPDETSPATSLPPALDEIRRLADRGQAREALRRCEALLETDRMAPANHLFHGLLLEQLGRDDAAEQALRRALYLDRGYVLAHYHLGLTLLKTGERAAAAKALGNAVRLLAATDPAKTFPTAEDISATELRTLARMHLDLIEG